MEIVICVIVGIISFFVLLAIVYKLRAGSKNKTEITETTTTFSVKILNLWFVSKLMMKLITKKTDMFATKKLKIF